MSKLLLITFLIGLASCTDGEVTDSPQGSRSKALLEKLETSRNKIENPSMGGDFSYELRENNTQSFVPTSEVKERRTSFQLDSYGEVAQRSYQERSFNHSSKQFDQIIFEYIETQENSNIGFNTKGHPIRSIDDLYNDCSDIIEDYADELDIELILEFDANGFLSECKYLNFGISDMPYYGIIGLSITYLVY